MLAPLRTYLIAVDKANGNPPGGLEEAIGRW
jgi:hypothetical protein